MARGSHRVKFKSSLSTGYEKAFNRGGRQTGGGVMNRKGKGPRDEESKPLYNIKNKSRKERYGGEHVRVSRDSAC